MLTEQTVLLARTIRGSDWYRMKRRELGRSERPTEAQVLALVDRVLADAEPAPIPAGRCECGRVLGHD